MCEVFEEIRQETREETREETLLGALRNSMESFHVSAKEALEALRVPETEREHFLAKLQAQ